MSHRVLLVEDNPDASEIVCAILRSLGFFPRAAATVEGALAAIAEEEFCLFVLDQQLPLNDDDPKPFVTGGERVTTAARQSDPRRTPDGAAHVTPIVALSGASTRTQFVAGLFKRGIDAFVEKDVCERVDEFSREVREALEKGGRGDHAGCAALARRFTSPSKGADPVRIAIDGKVTTRGRTEVRINGAARSMRDGRFVILLRSIVARERSREAWSSKQALGIGESRSATTQIREAFAGLIPSDFEIFEGDRRGNFRLSPAVVVEVVDYEALEEHPHGGVAALARERRRAR